MTAITALPASLAGLALLALAACSSGGGVVQDPNFVPENAETTVRVVENGDEVTEYRVAGQLRTVKVKSANGPTYYLQDSDGDGMLDESSNDGPVSPVYYKLFQWN